MDRALEDDHKVTSPKGPKPQGVPGSNNPDKEHDKTIDLANTNISIDKIGEVKTNTVEAALATPD